MPSDLQAEIQSIHATAEILKSSAGPIDFLKTLALLRHLKAGTVTLDQVEILPDGWKLIEPGPIADTVAEE